MGLAGLAVTPDRLGEYQLVRRLGGGGMGEVYLARRIGAAGFAREVALKVILPELAEDPRLRQMFLREGRLGGALSHRAIVQVFDLVTDGARPFLAMEYLRGLNLRDLVRAAGGRLKWPAAAFIAGEVARGLAAAHERTDGGLVHGDISPSNVMACHDGAVKILDFGLARQVGDERSSPGLEGKLAYMPPEAANGATSAPQMDIYALAVVLYEIVAGQRPFVGKNEMETLQRIFRGTVPPPSALVPGVPRELDALIAQAMHRDRARRTARAADLADQLDAVVGGRFGSGALADLVAGAMPEESSPRREEDPGIEAITLVAGPPTLTATLDEPGPVTVTASRSHALDGPVTVTASSSVDLSSQSVEIIASAPTMMAPSPPRLAAYGYPAGAPVAARRARAPWSVMALAAVASAALGYVAFGPGEDLGGPEETIEAIAEPHREIAAPAPAAEPTDPPGPVSPPSARQAAADAPGEPPAIARPAPPALLADPVGDEPAAKAGAGAVGKAGAPAQVRPARAAPARAQLKRAERDGRRRPRPARAAASARAERPSEAGSTDAEDEAPPARPRPEPAAKSPEPIAPGAPIRF